MTATIVLILRIGLAVVLYYFLWRVLHSLWQDLKQQGSLLADQKKPGIQINAVLEGTQDQKFTFWQTEILIGRGANSSISVNDESLSAIHARLSFHHGQWWLEDLGSTNGTVLNGDRIITPTVVISDDRFQCGNTMFSLQIDPLDDRPSKQTSIGNGGNE